MIFSDTCFSCENTFSDANAMCCCGAIQNKCCPNDCPFPAILYARIASISGCPTLSARVIQFNYNSTSGRWEYVGNLGGVCSLDITIEFWCEGEALRARVVGEGTTTASCINCGEREVLFGSDGFIGLPMPATCCSGGGPTASLFITDRSDGMVWCCDCSQQVFFRDVTCGNPLHDPPLYNISEFFDLTISGFSDGCLGSCAGGCPEYNCKCANWNGTHRITKLITGCEWIKEEGAGQTLRRFRLYWSVVDFRWHITLVAAFNGTVCEVEYSTSSWNCCGTNTLDVATAPGNICCASYPATIIAAAAGKCADCSGACADTP